MKWWKVEPETLPFVAHSATSELAAHQAKPAAPTQRARVFACICAHGPLPDEDIQQLLSLDPSTQRPRRVELARAGLIVAHPVSGRTTKGRRAVRWVKA